MLLIRRVEDLVQALFLRGEVYGTTHLYSGQEAVAVGFASALEEGDRVACTYRGHGHAMALGLEPEPLVAELLGRTTGINGGRAGSMNIVDREHGLLGCYGIVGGSIAAATGAALALKGTGSVAVACFGDGTANQAYFFECLNFAKVLTLPLVFVCENNGYGEYADGGRDRGDDHRPGEDLEIPTTVVDGMDVWATRAVALEVIAPVRAGEGPTFVEARTYRFVGHSRSDPGEYRPEGELEEWQARDPLACSPASACSRSSGPRSELDEVAADVERELAAVEEAALRPPSPSPSRSRSSSPDVHRSSARSASRGQTGQAASRASARAEAKDSTSSVGASLRERRGSSASRCVSWRGASTSPPALCRRSRTAGRTRPCGRSMRSSMSSASPSTRSSPPPSRAGPHGSATVQRAGSHSALDLESGVRWERLTAENDPDVDFLYATYEVGGASSPDGDLLRHSGREFGIVVRGQLGVRVGFEEHVLGQATRSPSIRASRIACTTMATRPSTPSGLSSDGTTRWEAILGRSTRSRRLTTHVSNALLRAAEKGASLESSSIDWGLAGKAIVVTGATSGIGAQIVRALATAGASIALVGRDEERLAQEWRRSSNAAARRSRLRRPRGSRSPARIVSETVAAFGGIDGFVHCASLFEPLPLADSSLESLERQMRVNVVAPFAMTQAALEHLRPGCSIVFVASTIALVGFPVCSAYTATKGATVSMARAFAIELAPKQVRVNTVCPGYVYTPMFQPQSRRLPRLPRVDHRQDADRQDRRPEEIAPTVLFLLSGLSDEHGRRDTRFRWRLDRPVADHGSLGRGGVRAGLGTGQERARAAATLLVDLDRDRDPVRDQPAARDGQRLEERPPLDASVRRDPRDRLDRPDARDPAARARPVGCRDDHIDDDHHHEGTRTATAASCQRRSGSSRSPASARGSSAGSRSRGSASPRSSRPSARGHCCKERYSRSRAAQQPCRTPESLSNFALEKTLGLPNTVWIAIVVLAIVSAVIRMTVLGRRFVAVGANPPAARAAGIPVRSYELGTYIAAALTYGIAGVLIAGYLRTPGIATGNDYLLPTIAAVVLGGTALAGGVGSVIASAGGALFLTQLEQVVLGMGAPSSVQLIIQGAIIALGMALRTAPWHRFTALLNHTRNAMPTLHDVGEGVEP